MSFNLYGETIYELDDICELVTKRAMSNGVYALHFNINSEKQGFWLTPKTEFSTHDTPGIYSIFKGKTLEYIGRGTSIGNRLSRFVKEVHRHSRSDEGHAGAEKWRCMYGEDLKDCYVMFSEYYDFDEKEYGYDLKQIEKRLIQIHKPRLNVK